MFALENDRNLKKTFGYRRKNSDNTDGPLKSV